MNRSLLRMQNQHAGVVGVVRGGGAGSALFRRVPITLEPDPSRVITRLFIPGGEDRIRTILGRIAALDEARVRALDEQVLRDFSGRHKDLRGVLEDHFDQVAIHARGRRLSHARRRLIGAYFHYAGGWGQITAQDRSPKRDDAKGARADPLHAVWARALP